MSAQEDGADNKGAQQTIPDDLYDYLDGPAPRIRPPRRAPSPRIFHVEALPVTDDWPEDVPVTEAEIDVFERYFGDVLDRLFGLAGAEGIDLKSLSRHDNEKP